MSKLKEDFNYEMFFNALDEYLLSITDKHDEYKKQVSDKRKITQTYLKDIDKAIEDNLDIEKLKDDCDFLEIEMTNLFRKIVSLSIFSSSFPEKVNVESGVELLEEIKEYFISIEKYEYCIILQEVIDLLEE